MQFRGLLLAASIGVALLANACAAETDASEEEKVGSTDEAMSSKKSSSYGVTTFGGAGDYQALACGGNSRTVNHWYVASSQRYGCHTHLKLTAKGKCLVVYTADAGPASFVESHAGMPVLDSSPAVGEYFFSEDSLGWSDIAAHPTKYKVNVVVTSDPVGPC